MKIFGFIFGFSLSFYFGIFTYTYSDPFLFTLNGFFNFFIYLGNAMIPAVTISLFISGVLLLIKLSIWVLFNTFTDEKAQEGDESFVYVVDTE